MVLNDNLKYRSEVQGVLSRLYEVDVFDNSKTAIGAMHGTIPDAVIIDGRMLSQKSADFLEEKGQNEKLKDVPIIVLGHEKPGDDLCPGPSAFIQQPFSANTILNQVATSISIKTEREWTKLPPVQRTTLQNTVSEFQQISNAIDSGEPLNVRAAQESCEPLIETIKNQQIQGVLDSVKGHHNYTYVHSLRVATFLSIFGHAIGMRGDDLMTLATGGLLHDVGKMVTPQGVLNAPRKLKDDEWTIMKGHVEHSMEILDRTPEVSKGIRIIAGQHHEKLDGTGYPLGLKGSQLNDLARMSAIVDIFGALTDVRSYKAAFTPEKAFSILESMDDGLDQSMVKKFRIVLENTLEQ